MDDDCASSDDYLLKEDILKTQEGISLFEKKERNGVESQTD